MKTDKFFKDWMTACSSYSDDDKMKTSVFTDLLQRYAETGRHYHNLAHIWTMLTALDDYYAGNVPVEVLFATWFHDSIYVPGNNNNEAESAKLCEIKLKALAVPLKTMDTINTMILQTANHQVADVKDENSMAFLDADLKILGVDTESYAAYLKAIRQEFSMYPDILFRRGRKQFIEKTLKTPFIYRTQKFRQLYEWHARENLAAELSQYR